MTVSPATPDQLHCILTPARAREVLAATPMGGTLDRRMTHEEARAVRELFDADPAGTITFAAIVRRIAACEGEAYALPRPLVVWKALAPHNRRVIAATAGKHLSDQLTVMAGDLDTWAELAGIYFPDDLPQWKVCVAADQTRYGYVYKRAASLADAVAAVTEDDVEKEATMNSEGLFGLRVVSALQLDADGSEPPHGVDGEAVDVPLGGYEVWVQPVGLVAAWRAVAEKVAATGDQAMKGPEGKKIAEEARALLAPFARPAAAKAAA